MDFRWFSMDTLVLDSEWHWIFDFALFRELRDKIHTFSTLKNRLETIEDMLISMTSVNV